MTEVSIVKCSSYDKKKVYEALKHSISLLGGMDKFVKKGERILLKPNLLSPKPPEEHITTHPEIVRALIRLVKEAGAVPFVGDSPGGSVLSTIDDKRLMANLNIYWEKTGMKKVCDEEGAELVSLETAGVKTFDLPLNRKIREVHISKKVLEFDGVITIPKLKTHALVGFTGAIKNLFGCVPGMRKTKYHFLAIHPKDFSQFMVDIFSIVKPRLGVFDGIVGMDGNGPSGGRRNQYNVIVSSGDCVALDLIGSMIIGFKPSEIDQVKLANKQNLGQADLSKINILGEKLQDVIHKDFLRPPGRGKIAQYMPQFVASIIGKFIWAYPEINKSKCTVCKTCVKSCPAGAISLHDGFPLVDRKKCINCMCCHELCTYYAIEIKLSPLANRFIK